MRSNRWVARGTRIAGALATALAVTAGAGAALGQVEPEMPGPGPRPWATPEAEVTPAPEAVPADSCPEVVRGVEVSTQPVKSGVAVEFTSPRREHVTELRLQLREIAATLEHQSKLASVQAEREGHANDTDLPAVDIAVREVRAGARLTVRAERVDDIKALRDLARAFEVAWKDSDCVRGSATSSKTPAPGPRV